MNITIEHETFQYLDVLKNFLMSKNIISSSISCLTLSDQAYTIVHIEYKNKFKS